MIPLRQWREAHTLTQANLADQCGVRLNTIARIEQGIHLPRQPLLWKLMALTGLTPNEIFAGAMHPQKRSRGRPRKNPPPT